MKSLLAATLIAALTFVSTPAIADGGDVETSSTQAYAEPPTKNLRITKYAKGVNKPCFKESDKVFIVKVFVHPDSLGNFAPGSLGVGEIVLKNDRQLNTDDYQVGPDYLETDFFFYAPSRFSKIKKDPLENSVTVQLAGPNMWFEQPIEVYKDCLEHFGDEDGQ